MNLNLEDREWKRFRVNEIFSIENCKCSKISDLKKGKTPYVGATNRNNGVLHFVEEDKSLITKGNCIAFICDGEGSMGLSIYKAEAFIGSTTVKAGRNEHLNKYIGMFITTIADKVRPKYNFGFKRNTKHLKNEILILPVNSKNVPDYAFMESYMRAKEAEVLAKYKEQISTRIQDLKANKEKLRDDVKWKEFKMTDIFSEIQRGRRLRKADHKIGTRPYVSSTGMNNGVDGFISNDEGVRIFSNCLTVANSGSVGSTFYHPYSFVASDHVTKLENKKYSKYVYLFIANLTSRFAEKYSFNREINDKRIRTERILLPVNDKNEPDYEYMEQYMKNLEAKKLERYYEYKLKEV